MDLRNAVCIVTGSATGIGAACVLELARRGCRTVVNYTKSEEEAKRTAAECERLGAESLLIRANVAEDADCRRMAETVLTKWGRIDGLINNAGTTKFVFNHADLDALNAADFHNIYAVNVIGAFQMVRAVEPTMRKQGHGSVVNISSRVGLDGGGSSLAYAVSKGALNTMTKDLARALGPQIRVNAVCPGFVETRWLKDSMGERYEAVRKQYAAASALQRAVTPEEVADTAIWLLSGAATVTGELVRIDAGNRLGPPPRLP